MIDIINELRLYPDYDSMIIEVKMQIKQLIDKIRERKEELHSYQMTASYSGMPNGKGGNSSKVETIAINYLEDEKLKEYLKKMKLKQKTIKDIKDNKKLIDMRLAMLPDEYQKVIKGKIFENKTFSQLKDEIGKNAEQNVSDMLDRALKKLEDDYKIMCNRISA